MAISANKSRQPNRPKQLRSPKNFDEAFRQGWRIVEDLSSWPAAEGCTKREGFLILKRPGCGIERLQIPYKALYDCGRPYFFPSDVE